MVPRETGNNSYAKFWRDKQNLIIPKASVLKSYSDFNRDSGKLGNNPSASLQESNLRPASDY